MKLITKTSKIAIQENVNLLIASEKDDMVKSISIAQKDSINYKNGSLEKYIQNKVNEMFNK